MSILSNLIPGGSTPWALLGVATIVGAGAFGWEYTEVLQRDKTIMGMQSAAKQAQLDQNAADMKASAQILAAQATQMQALTGSTLQALQKVASEPKTTSCGPAIRDAARSIGVQQHPGGASGKAP